MSHRPPTLFEDEPTAAPAARDPGMPLLSFVISGRPQQRGSKNAMARYGRDGKPIMVNGRVVTYAKDSNEEKSKVWMDQVRATATAAWGYGRPLIDQPIMLGMRFYARTIA